MTPVEFLTKNTYSFQPAQYNEAMADANNMDTKEWVSKWGPVFEAHENLAVDWNNSDLSKFNKDKWTRIRETFGSDDKKNPFNKPEADLNAKWQKDFKDMSFGDFKKAVRTMSNHWENEKKAREYESGRYKREQEVKKGGPKWWLASEYSKNRYINEPEKSIFSDEGDILNKGDDIRDVMLGGAGTVGDFIPGIGAVLGPAARGVRDAANYGTPYGKELGDIAGERAWDLGTFGAAALLPNFRRGKRMLNEFGREAPGVGNVIKSSELKNDIGETLRTLDALSEPYRGGAPTFADVTTRIARMPESPAKAALQKKLEAFTDVGNPEALEKFYQDIAKTAKAQKFNFTNYAGVGIKDGNFYVKPIEIAEQDIPAYKIRELMGAGLTREQAIKALKRENDVIGKKVAESYQPLRQQVAETKPLGTVGKFMRDKALPFENKIEQGLAKQTGRVVENDIADKDRKLKDWYIKNYAKDWELGFKPNEKEGDPLWEAYKEYKGIK